MLIGYARAADGDDDAHQRAALTALGVPADRLRIDHDLRTRADLPARTAMLDALQADDTVVVTGLERLARSAADLADVATVIERRRARLHVGADRYDPATDTGRAAFHMLTTVFPAFEAGIFSLRLSGPREQAKQAGRFPGGQPRLTTTEQRELYDAKQAGTPVADLQEKYGLSQSGIYKYLRQERRARDND